MNNLPARWALPIGAQPADGGTRFRVWAADAREVAVVLYDNDQVAATVPLKPEEGGYFAALVPGVGPGAHYMYRIDGGDPRPDPASRWQPVSVHGASCVVDPAAFSWSDGAWRGLPLSAMIVYETHVGTATTAGTFDALIERLDELRDLGITTIELMPLADFPGDHNWGYDGVCLFAPVRAYGGPEGLRRLVDAAHARGLAVLLDVVYNHLGPDGNYLRQFSRDYFTDRHKTPWGDALNFDGPNSRAVRDFFIYNACYWAHEYHIDGFRLDATHAIIDDSTPHILAELATAVRATLPADRHFVLIAENERNDPQLVRAQAAGGLGLDGVWADDFHHQLRVALAGDNDGYYIDYTGSAADIAATLRQGWFYTGQYSPFLKHERGAAADDIAYPSFVHCIQNHDQIGNRAFGDRLNHQLTPAAYRAASALLLFTPATPLLFQGQEWAASTPFLYFTDHNPELGRLVTQGRRAEFASFAAFAGATIPDPQAPETFARSKLDWAERDQPEHAAMLRFYQALLALRRYPALQERSRASVDVAALGPHTVALRRTPAQPDQTLLMLVHLAATPAQIDLSTAAVTRPPDGMRWRLLLDSESASFGGDPASSPALADPADQVAFAAPRAVVIELWNRGSPR